MCAPQTLPQSPRERGKSHHHHVGGICIEHWWNLYRTLVESAQAVARQTFFFLRFLCELSSVKGPRKRREKTAITMVDWAQITTSTAAFHKRLLYTRPRFLLLFFFAPHKDKLEPTILMLARGLVKTFPSPLGFSPAT